MSAAAQTAAEVAETNRLAFLTSLPPGSRRNNALLDWLERRRTELRLSWSSREPATDVQAGWGELERLPFQEDPRTKYVIALTCEELPSCPK